MRMSSLIRLWLHRLRTPKERRLRAQLDKERDRNRRLEKRVADLQAANEGAYHELAIARGVVCIKANCPRCKTPEGAA